MFKRIWNIFISFLVILQGFRGQNPKYRRGNVKGSDDYMILDEQTFRIEIDQRTLLV